MHCNGLAAVDFEKHRGLTRMPRTSTFFQHGFTVELKNLVSDAERRVQRLKWTRGYCGKHLRKSDVPLHSIACRMSRLERKHVRCVGSIRSHSKRSCNGAYAISQHAKLRVTNIGVYGLTLVMKVPQLARMTRGASGIISFPIQMLPSSSATAAE